MRFNIYRVHYYVRMACYGIILGLLIRILLTLLQVTP